jgi:DNA-binding response OmpR family regulator
MTPTIFLTSRDDRDSLLKGFNIGADDYMRKPIDLDELSLRIKALLRRQIRSDIIKFNDYSIDCNAKRLYYKDRQLSVTAKAIDLLLLLFVARGEVVSIEEIQNRLWHFSEDISLGSIRVYINTLKRYFPSNIENIRGVGYRFVL